MRRPVVKEEIVDFMRQRLQPVAGGLKELEDFARAENVPVIPHETVAYFRLLLESLQPEKILEIGTAIGYTSIKLAEKIGCNVTTIERDDKMYNEAKNNIEKRNLTDKITLLHADALELQDEVVANAPYDVVFIDGAKSQSRKFFELYEPYFAEDVVVITDNVLFKGMVADPSIIKHSRDLKQLSRKINNYNEWLLKHENYESVILPFGDGITITTRK